MSLARYEPSLDGIRAGAVTAVVAYHATPWLQGGWAGVDAFFVLSGFLITSLLMQEIAASGSIDMRRFYLRRVLRLTPAFAVVLLFSLVVAALLPLDRTDNLRAILIAGTYLMNWNRAFSVFPQAWLGHTWSLATEEQFYLLWPATLLLIGARRPLLSILTLLVSLTAWRCHLVLSGASGERIYNGFDTHADALLIGCALAAAPLPASIQGWAQRLAWIPLVGAALVVVCLPMEPRFTQIAGLSLTAVLSAWIAIAALEDGWLKACLSLKPLRYTGRISYGWYLWHYPVILLGEAHLPHFRGLGVLLVTGSYALAAASYHCVEKPFLRLKARFEPATKSVAVAFASQQSRLVELRVNADGRVICDGKAVDDAALERDRF